MYVHTIPNSAHPPPDPHSVYIVKGYRQENTNATFPPFFSSSVSRQRALSCRPRRTLQLHLHISYSFALPVNSMHMYDIYIHITNTYSYVSYKYIHIYIFTYIHYQQLLPHKRVNPLTAPTRPPCERVMSHTWMSHVTYVNESRHICKSVTNETCKHKCHTPRP